MIDSMVVIEITTKYNFDCDYCYTKQYDDEMMFMDRFVAIIDELRDMPPTTISLSGEGESLLHPLFWDFVEHIRNTTHHKVAVITNGSPLTEDTMFRLKKTMSMIMVSLDTMDAELAERVGRHYHDRVIAAIRRLADIKVNLCILTTDFGQDITPVKQFIRSLPHSVRHTISPLQSKTDYVTSYTMFETPLVFTPRTYKSVRCNVAAMKQLTMYSIDGHKLPCCFIKDRSAYTSYDDMVNTLSDPLNKTVPVCCTGCRHLTYST